MASSATRADARRSGDYAARAVSLLERARQQGFFRVAANAKGLLTHDGLAALRDRDDFRALLREVNAIGDGSG